MLIEFRQGIVSHPIIGSVQNFLQVVPSQNAVDIITANGSTLVTFAHKTANYLITESFDVVKAWTIQGAVDQWLYWDINTATGQLSYGTTLLEPITSVTAPLSPQVGQMWYDLSTNTMKEYGSGKWSIKIRVFAAKLVGGVTLQSMSSGIGNQSFAGPQTGIYEQIFSGRILFEEQSNQAIQRTDGTFVTTEDQFIADSSQVHAVRLESIIFHATATQNIGAYSIVKVVGNNQVALANYNDTSNTVIALSTNPTGVDIGDTCNLVVQGVISNSSWNFSTPGQALWISDGGALTETDPHIIDPITYKTAKVPVARVINRTTIFFDQGMGAKGEKGDRGDTLSTIPRATNITWGITKLTTPPLTNNDPIAVSSSDPYYMDLVNKTDSIGWWHNTHHSDDVDVDVYTASGTPQKGGIGLGGTLTNAIQDLENNKVDRAGDTLTGFLELHADPINPMHSATKQYVDNITNGLVWRAPICLTNLISNKFSAPPTTLPYYPYQHGDTYLVANGASGDWTGLDRHLVQWDAGVSPSQTLYGGWIDLGTIESKFDYKARFGMNLYPENTTRTTASDDTHGGSNIPVAIIELSTGDVVVDGKIAEYDIASDTWDFYTPTTGDAVLITDDFDPDTVYTMNQFVFEGEYGISGSWVRFGGPNSILPGRNLKQFGNVFHVDVPEILQTDGSLPYLIPYGVDGISIAENPDNSLQYALNKLFATKAEISPQYPTFADLSTNLLVDSSIYGMIAYVVDEQRSYICKQTGWELLTDINIGRNLSEELDPLLGTVYHVDVPEIIPSDITLQYPLTYGIDGITSFENPDNSLQIALNKLFATKAELSPSYPTFADLNANVAITPDHYGMVAYVVDEEKLYVCNPSGWELIETSLNLGRNLIEVPDILLGSIIHVDVPEIVPSDVTLQYPLTYGIEGITSAENPDNSLQVVLNKLFATKAELSPAYPSLVDLQTNIPVTSSVHGMLAYVTGEQALYVCDPTEGWREVTPDILGLGFHHLPLRMIGNMSATDDTVDLYCATKDVDLNYITFDNSKAFCKVPPAATTYFQLYHMDTTGTETLIGLIQFNVGSYEGVFYNVVPTSVSAGDVLELRTPTTLESTIKHVALTVVGCSSTVDPICDVGGTVPTGEVFEFVQVDPVTSVTIPHNLGHNVLVRVFVDGTEVYPQINYPDANNVTITFSVPKAFIARMA